MIITLEDFELRVCKVISIERYKYNRRLGHESGMRIPEDHFKNELNGVAAEFALAKALNVWPPLSVTEAAPADMLFNNVTIDVKQTPRKAGRLIMAVEKRKFCDWYCLVTGVVPEFTIVGFAKLGDLRKEENLKDLGYGPTYVLEREELINMQTFVKTIGL